MTEFTSDLMKEWRDLLSFPQQHKPINKDFMIIHTLDEIESLQAKVKQRSRELQYANKIATEEHHKVQRLQARVAALEEQIQSLPDYIKRVYGISLPPESEGE